MIIFEITEDKFGKAMKAVTKIVEHAECLHDFFEDMAEDSNYGDRYENRKHYDDDDMYGSRYGMRHSTRRY